MGKLDDLINKLCPSGVEYKTLGEVAIDIYRGSGITRDQVTDNGISCVRYGEIYTTYDIWFDKCKSHTHIEDIASPKYFEHGDILFAITGESVADIAKSTAYVGNEKCLAGGDIVVLKHSQNPKYLSYALSTYEAQQQKSKGKIKSKVVHSSVPAISEIVVPVPPLEVQNEIVRILDKFTSLEAELEAELEARRKQYEYYRDSLLSFEDDAMPDGRQVEWKTLGEIAKLQAGKAISAFELASDKTESLYPCYGGNGLRGYIKKYSDDGNYSIIGRQGALCGNVKYVEGKFYATEHAVVVYNKEPINSKYLYYILVKMNLNQYKSAGAQPGLSVAKLVPLKIPIPTLSEQQRIVSILDRFESLCNDITSGLPAEIKARHKQYEYYRDKLLTFKKKV